jgi:hypothetical protein
VSVTLNYTYPVTGATPPTAAQASVVSSVIATLLPTSSTDASQIVTHNFGLPAADITAGWPTTVVSALDLIGAINNWFVISQNPNYTVLGKNASAGTDSVAQVQVTITRPHSMVR